MKNSSKVKVLVLGRSGQLAQQLFNNRPSDVELSLAGRVDLDITSFSSVEQYIISHSPDVVINTAAYTSVDQAESEFSLAELINTTAVYNIAKVCFARNIKLIHISTDFVFDGKKSSPYSVLDKPNPLNVYGLTKYAGEKALLNFESKNFSVIRTSWLYSVYGNNFLKTMIKLMSTRTNIDVVADQISCPTSAVGLARFIYELILLKDLNPIYNWSDLGVASWFDYAKAIHEISLDLGIIERSVQITPIKSSDYRVSATRPAFSLLDVSDSLHICSANYWRDNVRNTLKDIKR